MHIIITTCYHYLFLHHNSLNHNLLWTYLLTIIITVNKLTQNFLSIFNRMPGTHQLIPVNMNNYSWLKISDSFIYEKYSLLTLSHFAQGFVKRCECKINFCLKIHRAFGYTPSLTARHNKASIRHIPDISTPKRQRLSCQKSWVPSSS